VPRRSAAALHPPRGGAAGALGGANAAAVRQALCLRRAAESYLVNVTVVMRCGPIVQVPSMVAPRGFSGG